MNETTNRKPNTSRAILSAMASVIIFIATYSIAAFLASLLFYIVFSIPLIGTLLQHFFSFRGDSPSLVIALLSAYSAYFMVNIFVEKICTDTPTTALAYKVLGVAVAAIELIFLAINARAGISVLPNIAQIICGGIFFFKGKWM